MTANPRNASAAQLDKRAGRSRRGGRHAHELGCGVVQQVPAATEQVAAALRPSAVQRGSSSVKLAAATVGTTTLCRYLLPPCWITIHASVENGQRIALLKGGDVLVDVGDAEDACQGGAVVSAGQVQPGARDGRAALPPAAVQQLLLDACAHNLDR